MVTLSDAVIDRVVTFKLLGVNVASDLKWNTHIEAIWRKAASRLYFLNSLNWPEHDWLICWTFTALWFAYIVLEYARPVWHSSLTAAQTKALIYRREQWTLCFLAALIILHDWCGHTDNSARIPDKTIFFRRRLLPGTYCLHYLLPEKNDPGITNKLRYPKTFQSLTVKTERFRKLLYHIVYVTTNNVVKLLL